MEYGRRSWSTRRDETNHRKTLTNHGSRFLSAVPSFPFSLPFSLVNCQEGVCCECHHGLNWCPPWVTSAHRSQQHTWLSYTIFSWEQASGTLKLLKERLCILFEKENALQHVLHRERRRPTLRAQTELQTKETSALFMTDLWFYSQGSEVNYYKNADRTCNICLGIIHPAIREPQISLWKTAGKIRARSNLFRAGVNQE